MTAKYKMVISADETALILESSMKLQSASEIDLHLIQMCIYKVNIHHDSNYDSCLKRPFSAVFTMDYFKIVVISYITRSMQTRC